MSRLTRPRLIVAIAFAGIFAMAARPSMATDTWWHLRAGEWMVRNGQILTRDEFSFTRFGQEWINHSWLSQIPLYLLWNRFGYAGLNLLTAALVTLAFVAVYRQLEGSAYLKAFTLVLAAAASGLYWSARPQIFSFALAGLFAYVLHAYRRGVNRLWLLVPLMALWVNLHGGFAIGFILMGLTIVGEILGPTTDAFAGRTTKDERRPTTHDGRRTTDDRRPTTDQLPATSNQPPVVSDQRPATNRHLWLGGTILACAAVVPLNPFGARMLLYPFRTVSIGVLQDYIQEWMSPNFHQREAQPFIWLLLATMAAIGLSRKRVHFTDLLLVSGFAYLALLAARNVALFALVAAPVLARHAAAGLQELRARYPRSGLVAVFAQNGGQDRESSRGSAILNWAVLGLVVVAAVVKVGNDARVSVNQAEVEKSQPVAAVEFIRSARPSGPMFNSYNWGGYLAWALYPEYPVYVDGRTDLYDDEFLREYLGVATGQPEWRQVFAREGIRLAVIERDSFLADELRREAGWRVTYSDSLAVVFEPEMEAP